MYISVIAWIVMGLIVGLVASKLVKKRDEGLPFDMLLGTVGAVLGGWIFNAARLVGAAGFNIWSLLAAVVGAVVFLVVWYAIRGSAARV